MKTASVEAYLKGGSRALATVRGNRDKLECYRTFSVCTNVDRIGVVGNCAQFRSVIVRRVARVLNGSGVSLSSDGARLVVSAAGNGVRLLTGSYCGVTRHAFLCASTRMVTRCFRSCGGPVMVSGTYVSNMSTFVITHRVLLSRGIHRMIVINYSALYRFVASNFTSFGSVDPGPYGPCSTRHSNLGLNRTYKTIILSISRYGTRTPVIHVTNNTVDGSTGRVSKPSHANSKLCCTVGGTLSRTNVNERSINFIGARNATAHCGSRVRDGTIT